MHPTAGVLAQRDRTLLDARRERDRAQSELHAHCPDAFGRIYRFGTAWFAREHMPALSSIVGHVDGDGLDHAAETVLAAVQYELSTRSSPLAKDVATVFAQAYFYAIKALSDRYGHSE